MDTSVYLQARSGFGTSVLTSQLEVPRLAGINADEHRTFAQFRQRLWTFMQARYRGGAVPETPRDLARALDRAVAASSDARLVLAIDDADWIDNGVRVFREETIGSASHVRVVVTASTLRFKRQKALEASGRLRVLSAPNSRSPKTTRVRSSQRRSSSRIGRRPRNSRVSLPT